MTMTSDEADEAILALTTFSDRLSRTSPTEAKNLDTLLRTLRLAASEERDDASGRIDRMTAKLDQTGSRRDSVTAGRGSADAHAKAQAAGLELRMAHDEVLKLRQEVARLKHEVKRLRQREQGISVERDSVATKDEGRQARSSSNTELNDNKHIEQDRRGSHAHLRERGPSSTSASSGTLRSDSKAREHHCRADSYNPPVLSPKHQRTDSGDELFPSPPTTSPLLSKRGPVCGSCKKHGLDALCDGKAEGSNCQRGNTWCAYWRCDQRSGCPKDDCTYLHPNQWNVEAEGDRRMIR